MSIFDFDYKNDLDMFKSESEATSKKVSSLAKFCEFIFLIALVFQLICVLLFYVVGLNNVWEKVLAYSFVAIDIILFIYAFIRLGAFLSFRKSYKLAKIDDLENSKKAYKAYKVFIFDFKCFKKINN